MPEAEDLDVREVASRFEALLGGDEPEEVDGGEETTEDDVAAPEGDLEEDDSEDEAEESDEDEDEDSEEVDDAEPAAPVVTRALHTVKVQGEEVKVTTEELIAGYSRTADYTRKTQIVAQKDRELEAERQQLRAERQQYAALLPRLVQQIEVAGMPAEPNWAQLREEDPAEFAARRVEWEDFQRTREANIRHAAQEFERIQRQEAAESENALRRTLAREQELLTKVLPAWSDPDTARVEREQLAEFAMRDMGFTPDDLNHVSDHRLVRLLHYARKGYEVEKKVKTLTPPKKKPAGPKPVQPGTRVASETAPRKTRMKKARERLRVSGSVEDAARAFENILR